MEIGHAQNGNTYIIDNESGAEMTRLIDQDLAITQAMGGLFPQNIHLSKSDFLLDIACGPGGWALEVARSLPETRIVGVDISQKMIAYANAYVSVQRLENIYFAVMDITKPLVFADNEFTVVNARFLASFLRQDMWTSLIKECSRVTCPGGLLLLTESDAPGKTNSLAFERYQSFLLRAMAYQGLSQHPLGTDAGATPMLRNHLRMAGYSDIRLIPHLLDFSAGTPAHLAFYNNIQAGFKLVQPFLIQQGIAQQEELDDLYTQVLQEMNAEYFVALLPFVTAIGRKPAK